MTKTKFKVLLAAAELTPLAKVGGLADVIGALPKALWGLKQDVRIVIPKYGIINPKKYLLKKIKSNITVRFEGKNEKINLYQTHLPDSKVIVYLIDHPKYLGAGDVYISADASSDGSITEAHRFTFFTAAIPEIFKPLGWTPDVLHCHDWHVGMLAPLVKLKKIKTPLLFTVHNLAYQGVYEKKRVFKMLGLTSQTANQLTSLKIHAHSKYLNYLEQSILNADFINTVSPNYAKEIITKEYGCGQEKNLKSRKKELSGILNGIDTERFNPETDPDIKFKFDHNSLNKKIKNKLALQKEAGFKPSSKTLLISVVGRLTEQKGFDIMLPVMEKILKLKIQFVLLGTGDKSYEAEFKKLSKKYNNFKAYLKFDAKLAQRIYASSDLFLMPSRFEPCGLGQMIAMRYGALPLVRATGGLKDTVTDLKKATGTGFVFSEYHKKTLYNTIVRASRFYYNHALRWQNAQRRAMQQDFSWTNSAKKYLKIYTKLLK